MSRGAFGDVITTLRSGAAPALLSAALFGASTPLAKLLLRGIDPWMLAGVLYLGSGLGLISLRIVSRTLGGVRGAEARVIRGATRAFQPRAVVSCQSHQLEPLAP